jgi:acyl-CoA reductase-like NAD-dependent aldehyde dehydrogenase
LLIGGRWTAARSGAVEEIRSPFDGKVVGEVATAGPADVEPALAAAERGAATWRRTPAHERMRVLLKAADLVDERVPQIAATLSAENGKTITEATTEAGRSADLIRLSAFEGTQLYGDTLPLDANKGTGFDKIGFTVRQPVGVIVAITPFNYPALLVLHTVRAGARATTPSPRWTSPGCAASPTKSSRRWASASKTSTSPSAPCPAGSANAWPSPAPSTSAPAS